MPSEQPKAQIIDLMEALKASLGVAPEAGGAGGAKPGVKRKAAKRVGSSRVSSKKTKKKAAKA